VTAYKSQDFTRTRLLQEIELICKEHRKAVEFKMQKAQIPYQRLQHHDPDKWRKKFKMLFEREKIIAFGKNSGSTVDLKRPKIELPPSGEDADQIYPKALKPVGKEILA
jgi:hypothetical protein